MNFMWWFPLTVVSREGDTSGWSLSLLWYDFWVGIFLSAPEAIKDSRHGLWMKFKVFICPLPCVVITVWWARKPKSDEMCLFYDGDC